MHLGIDKFQRNFSLIDYKWGMLTYDFKWFQLKSLKIKISAIMGPFVVAPMIQNDTV